MKSSNFMANACALNLSFILSLVMCGVVNSTWGAHVSMPTPNRPHELVVYLLTSPMKSASVSIQIKSFIEEAIAHYWSPPNVIGYYLMGIELGSEFAAPAVAASYAWDRTSFSLDAAGSIITLTG